jgi:hypothetical protein
VFKKAVTSKGVSKELRKLASNPKVLVSTAVLSLKGGSRALRSVMSGNSNMRFSPATMIGMIAYVEWELKCGKAHDGLGGDLVKLECGKYGLKGANNRSAVNTIYKNAFLDVADGKLEEEKHDDFTVYSGRGHGALFHLSQVAFFQIMHRTANGDPIKEIEASRWIYFYPKDDKVDEFIEKASLDKSELEKVTPYSYNRKLETAGKKERWIELKSYSGVDKGANRHLTRYSKSDIDIWTVTKKDNEAKHSSLHKQFTLDRAGATVAHAWRPTENDKSEYTRVDVASDFEWRWQQFQPRKKGPPTVGYSLDVLSTKTKSIVNVFSRKVAKNGSFPDMVEANLGATTRTTSPYVNAKRYIKEAGMKDLLTKLITLQFGDATDALAEEFAE